AAAFSSGLYLRVVGFPGDCSFGIAPSSFPRSGASRISRAIHAFAEGAIGYWFERGFVVGPGGFDRVEGTVGVS
ncbi:MULTISPECIES: hypothetical protein, partial [Mycobacterium avium complex (MAC)]